MKLLLDQNLSRRLLPILAPNFPASRHVAEVGLASASDLDVWNFARDNEFAILSKDGDFHQLSLVHGAPPKVIWLRIGNASTAEITDFIRHHTRGISAFLDDEGSLMVLGPETDVARDLLA